MIRSFAIAAPLVLALLGVQGCSGYDFVDSGPAGMTREGVLAGNCAAVIWLPPVQAPGTQAITETIGSHAAGIEGLRMVAFGEASDTADAYACFRSLDGQDAQVLAGAQALAAQHLQGLDLEVVAPGA